MRLPGGGRGGRTSRSGWRAGMRPSRSTEPNSDLVASSVPLILPPATAAIRVNHVPQTAPRTEFLSGLLDPPQDRDVLELQQRRLDSENIEIAPPLSAHIICRVKHIRIELSFVRIQSRLNGTIN